MQARRYYRSGAYRQPRTQRALSYRRRSYSSAYMPADYGGIRGAPQDRVGRGFRGTYSRSQAEKKYIDTVAANYVCDTTGSVTALNLCNEGTGVSQRVGRKICMKSVQVRGILKPIDGSTSSCHARVMLVWDKQVNGVIATISEILSAATSNSFMNLDNRERFVVIMDKHFAMGSVDATSGVSGSPTVTSINKYKKLPEGSYTIYDGTGAGIADINTGAFYLVTIGDTAAGDGALFTAACRVRYTDS